MKVQQHTDAVVLQSHGVESSSSFGFSRTPHMFRMLSSGLYSDKVAAVLREIGSNAYDAHVRVGTPDVPFEVKLPVTLDKSFWIRDCGPGLSSAELETNYNNYGWSDKQQKIDEIGGFGLGSKSPFAYTLGNDELSGGFTVESVKDGIKTICVCHLNSERIPTMSQLGHHETDEPSGLRVSFPVQEADIREFREKVKKVFCWFAVKPIVHGLDEPIKDPEFRMEGSFFKLGPVDSMWNAPAVVMGNVRYPINVEQLKGLRPAEQALLRGGLHLWLPIGSVQMVPSREQLEYVETTRRVLKDKLREVCLEMGSKIRASMQKPEDQTFWSWSKEIHTHYGLLPPAVQSAIEDLLVIAGEPVDSAKAIAMACSSARARLPKWVGYNGGPFTANSADADMLAKPVRAWYYFKGSYKSCQRKEITRGEVKESKGKTTELSFSFTADVLICYAQGTNAVAKVKKHVEETGQQVVLFRAIEKHNENCAKECAEYLATTRPFEGVPCTHTEALNVQLPRKPRVSSKAPKLTLRAHFAAQDVMCFTLDNPKLNKTKLGEVPSENVYYLCGYDENKASWEGNFFNKCASSESISYSRRDHHCVVKAVRELSAVRDFEVSAVLVVKNEAEAKKLRFQEQGIKPFMHALQAEFELIAKDEAKDFYEVLPNVTGLVTYMDFISRHMAFSCGMPGVMTNLKFTQPERYQELVTELADAPFMQTLSNFVTNACAQQKADREVLQLCNCIIEECNGLRLRNNLLSTLTTWEIRAGFTNLHPELGVFNFDRLSQMATDDFTAFKSCLKFVANAFKFQEPAKQEGDEKFAMRLVA